MQCGESLETGLHRAAFKGFVDVVQFLLSVGVDPGVQDKNVRALNPLVFFFFFFFFFFFWRLLLT